MNVAEKTSPDQFAHMNPAFSAVATAWMSVGFAAERKKASSIQTDLHVLWAMIGLTLLAPAAIRSRLPSTANGKLAKLFADEPDWKAAVPLALPYAAKWFWQGIRLGVTTGTLSVDKSGRLRCLRPPDSPIDEDSTHLMKKSLVLGKLFAKEPGDSATASILGFGLAP